MSLTLSNLVRSKMMNKNVNFFDIAFDSSYPFGGEALTPATMGLPTGVNELYINSQNGYNFQYDVTNEKLKVFAPAPPIVFEETVTVSAADVATLKYPHAYIMYVGVDNLTYHVIPSSLTPVTTSVAVTAPSAGVRPTLTFLPADAVDGKTCKVTYVTQAWKEVFDNYVAAVITAGARVSGHASLTFTAGTPDVVSLGELAVAIQNITWSDNGTIKPMDALYKAETAATTEATIDFSDTTTKIALLQSDTMDAAADSIYFDYIKKPASGFLFDRFVEEDDVTPATDVVTLSSGLGAVGSNALLYGTCGGLPGPTTKFTDLIRTGGTLGATATLVQPTSINNPANTFTLGSDHSDAVHLKVSYIAGYPWEIPSIVPLEVLNAEDLSGLTNVKVMAVSR